MYEVVDILAGVIAATQDIVDTIVVHVKLIPITDRTLNFIVHLDDTVVEAFTEGHIDLSTASKFNDICRITADVDNAGVGFAP